MDDSDDARVAPELAARAVALLMTSPLLRLPKTAAATIKYTYIPAPSDVDTTFVTIETLQAMKQMFEQGDGTAELVPLVAKSPGVHAEPAAALVLRDFADKVLGPGTADRLAHEVETAHHQELPQGLRANTDLIRMHGVVACWMACDEWPETEIVYTSDVTKPMIDTHGETRAAGGAGVSLGEAAAQQALEFQAVRHNSPVGAPIAISLAHGDVYFMSHKAAGNADGVTVASPTVTWRHSWQSA